MLVRDDISAHKVKQTGFICEPNVTVNSRNDSVAPVNRGSAELLLALPRLLTLVRMYNANDHVSYSDGNLRSPEDER
jgi:hypothetical protein